MLRGPGFLVHLATVLALMAALHVGRDILQPFALAFLISLLLAPAVARLQSWRIPRTPAVVLAVAVAFGAMGWIGWVVTGHMADLAGRLPRYEENIRRKLETIQGPAGSVLGRAVDTFQTLGKEVTDAARPKEAPPIPKVEVVTPPPTPLDILSGTVLSLVESLGTGAVVLLLVVFLLVYQADLRDRVAEMVGVGRVNVTLRMVDEAAAHTSRYLLLQTAVNLLYGSVLAVGLFALGIPNALLWGILAVFLRYLPYLGPWIAAAFPLFLSLAAFDGWTRTFLLAGFIVLLEIAVNNVAEPLVYGQGTGLSPLAVVVSAVFWAWLWGGLGLILAVPLTATLVTVARHVPPLRYLDILLGAQPRLDRELRLYQRLLAGDTESAVGLVEAYRKEASLEKTFDRLLVPALAIAEQNRHGGALEPNQARIFFASMAALLEEVDKQPAAPDPEGAGTVLLLPASDEADELCARMLARLLRNAGLRSRVLEAERTTGEKAEQAERSDPDPLCISALPPGALLPTRYLCKRIRARNPSRAILVGLWTSKEGVAPGDPELEHAFTLEDAGRRLREQAAALRPEEHA